MSDFNEQDFIRLIIDKDFAKEILMYKSHEMLRASYDLYFKEPDRLNEIISWISCAIERHLNTKEKIKVLHALTKEMRSPFVIGLRNLLTPNVPKIETFNKVLDNVLVGIELKEEGKILERDAIFEEIHPEKKKTIYNTHEGFPTSLPDEQILILFDALLKDKYIDKWTKRINFTAVFKDSLLPNDFLPVKWILLNRSKKPHKTALREFLTLALGKAPDQKTVSICFTDRKGNEILLLKPKSIQPSNHYLYFEKLVKL